MRARSAPVTFLGAPLPLRVLKEREGERNDAVNTYTGPLEYKRDVLMYKRGLFVYKRDRLLVSKEREENREREKERERERERESERETMLSTHTKETY